jgi:uncharacterized protein YkwD
MTRLTSPLVVACAALLAAALGGALAAPAAGSARHDATEFAVIRHVNAFRSAYGLPRVRPNRSLSRAADEHSRDMLRRDFFSHSSSDGTPFDHRVRRFSGASTFGETLALLGTPRAGAATVVRMWRDSPSHRAILLSGQFRRVGVARRRGTLGGAWQSVITADFASAR